VYRRELYADKLGGEEVKIMPSFACKDVGMTDDWKVKAKTEAELMQKVKEHAARAHNIKDISPEMMDTIKKAIKK
jgi:predicted small metal-binding protein